METPFTTLLTKGETGQCSAPGLFQDATMRCVRREEKRSPAITVRSGKKKKNSDVILEVDKVCIFTVHSNPEIELKELKQHRDEPRLHTSCFDFTYQQFRGCHEGHGLQSRMITLEIRSLHKSFQVFLSPIPLLIAFVSETEKQKHRGACQPYYDGFKVP